jgi:uncharacterized delta-60 repeat protein
LPTEKLTIKKGKSMKYLQFVHWRDAAKVLALWLSLCVPTAYCQPASQGPERPDASWTPIDGNSVIATAGVGTLYTDVFGSNDFGKAMVVLPDFGVIMAGHCFYPPLNKDVFCAVRYDDSGNLVTGWGSNNGKMVASVSTSNDQANAILLQPDGKFVLGGLCWDTVTSTNVFCVARFTPNGQAFDLSFNGTGIVRTSITGSGGNDVITSMALQPDGKILAAGRCGSSSNRVFCIARYNTDGSLDLSFNPNGASNGLGYFATQIGAFPLIGNDTFSPSMKVNVDGKILLGAYCYNTSASQTNVCLIRYNANGTLDTSFNGTGTRIVDVPDIPVTFALELQPDGRILVGGRVGSDFMLIRLNSSGSALDPRFAPSSSLGPGIVRTSITSNFDEVRKIKLQPDGKILAAGICNVLSGSRAEFCVARFHSDGNLDDSFATGSANGNGKLVLPMGAGTQPTTNSEYDRINDIEVLRDGRIMLGGSCFIGGNVQFCSARLLGSTFQRAWRNCSTDIDGDGRFLATTDGLINARVALGLTGIAVTNGITFAPGAQRNTWAAIREYLIEDCGLSIR